MVSCIIVSIVAYLLGSISFSVIFGKVFAGIDVREKGSKNAGATNVLRTAGILPAVLTLLCDCAKGVIAILIAFIVGNITKEYQALLVQLAGLLVVIGHTFPIFFKFKGGKGVATALGVLLITNWQIGLICLVYALMLMVLTRMVSLGSITAALLYPVLTLFISTNYLVEGNYVIFAILLAALVVFNHRSNVKRLMNGTENRLGANKDNRPDIKEKEAEKEVEKEQAKQEEKSEEEVKEEEVEVNDPPKIEVDNKENNEKNKSKKKRKKNR